VKNLHLAQCQKKTLIDETRKNVKFSNGKWQTFQ